MPRTRTASIIIWVSCRLAWVSQGGAEAMIHALRQWKFRNKDDRSKVVVFTDLSNAFNNLDRTAFRETVRNVIPQAGPWVDSRYEENSWLRLEKREYG